MAKKKKRRKNPAGGFWPAVGGFLAGPFAVGLATRASTAIVPPAVSDGGGAIVDAGGRATVAHVGGAVAAWHFSSKVRDPGWSSFLRGAMWGEIVAAIFTPVATVMALQAKPAAPPVVLER